MWAHYADDHSGFCLEFEKNKLVDWGVPIFPVHYVNEKVAIPELYIPFQTEWLYHRAAAMKSECWQYEKEWRIVAHRDFSKGQHFFRLPQPSAIYLGCQFNKNSQKSIMENHLLEEAKRKNMKIFQMKLFPDKYGLYKEEK
jgi:hypothetical protein